MNCKLWTGSIVMLACLMLWHASPFGGACGRVQASDREGPQTRHTAPSSESLPDLLGKLTAKGRDLNPPVRVNWVPPGNPGAQQVLIVYFNETPQDGEGANTSDVFVGWLQSSPDPELRKLADRLKDDRRQFGQEVNKALKAIKQFTVAAATPRYPISLALFTNRMASQSQFEYYRAGEKAIEQRRFPIVLARSAPRRWAPLAAPEVLRSCLAAVAEVFPPSKHEFILVTMSHGSATHAVVPILAHDPGAWSRDTYLKHVSDAVQAETARPGSTLDSVSAVRFRAAFGDGLGIAKAEYVSALVDAGARHGMYFRLVFAHACSSELSLVMIDQPDLHRVPVGVLYTSDRKGLQYAALDYDRVFTADPPAASFAEALNRALYEKHLADRTEAQKGLAPPRERVVDPPFDQFVDLRLLGRAWSELDAGLMTDVALQLLKGERILGRSHKLVSADDVLRVAVRMAGENGDRPTLERAAKAAECIGKAALAQEARELHRLAARGRTVLPSYSVLPVTTSAEAYRVYHAVRLDLRSARLAGDFGTLAALARALPLLSHLDASQRDYLRQQLGVPASDPDVSSLEVSRVAAATSSGCAHLRTEALLEESLSLNPGVGDGLAARCLKALREGRGEGSPTTGRRNTAEKRR